MADNDIHPFSAALETWYSSNGRDLPWRGTRDPYRIWVSEIILQQTRVAQGYDYFMRFMERFPTVERLAAATEDDVLHAWQGLGYYTRARNLHAAARAVVAQGGFPTDYAGVRALRGVGDYTAATRRPAAALLPIWPPVCSTAVGRGSTTKPSWTSAPCNACPVRRSAGLVRWLLAVRPCGQAVWMSCP